MTTSNSWEKTNSPREYLHPNSRRTTLENIIYVIRLLYLYGACQCIIYRLPSLTFWFVGFLWSNIKQQTGSQSIYPSFGLIHLSINRSKDEQAGEDRWLRVVRGGCCKQESKLHADDLSDKDSERDVEKWKGDLTGIHAQNSTARRAAAEGEDVKCGCCSSCCDSPKPTQQEQIRRWWSYVFRW